MKDNKQQKSVSTDDRFRKGLWSTEEDEMLLDYVNTHGKGHWNSVSKKTGLKRSGKSCRLRWMNYLSPTIKRERFTEDEEDLIIRLHNLLGNRWALIAGRVPGRTDNQVKNHWNTHLSKKILSKGFPSAPSHCKPATTHSGKLKTCCSNNLRKSVTEDQAISSDFSSNTVYGTEGSIAVPKETASREGEETKETTGKSNQLHAREASDAGEVEQTGAAAAGDRDNDQGSCFMQYFDDYTLNFVLSNNQRNVGAAGV